ncbi:conserved hypothetical protein [Ricinus communis]|uniref:DUF4378 domain-containing protein n=1 Tax=Ricinus communis TaxID=3988 RepID=B9RZL7_RICCO|nr:conserved hypothetical protein [Ricinus communis]
MGVEKEGSKNGAGYVGGFFQLFDWTAKSRKKLFSSKSDLPARSKQGKRSDGNLPMTRLNLMDEDETAAGSSIRGSSDYSCASSVTDDDGFGARAPGVVARLMGLDSMPTSSFAEPNCTPFLDTQSLREASQRRKHFEYYHDPQIMYSGILLNKEEGPPRNFLESKPQKVLSRPIEKFQTEILPPKSAKSIPVTHHKLLSPIKSPGFIPSKTAAHIMEAAARIIEPSPQAIAKAKISMVGSSSVPLKVRDLKEKLEGAQKMPLVGSSSLPLKSRDLKEKLEAPNRTSRLAEASRRPAESSPETEEGASGLKNKGKSISLAIQAKVNVQRREGLNTSNSRTLVGQKDQSEAVSSQNIRSQPNIQKSLPRKSVHNGPTVLRQNNQKQNCIVDKDKSSKSPISNSQCRKTPSGNPSVRQKTSGKTAGSKTGTRKLSPDVTDSEKGLSSYSIKHIPRKKRSIDGTLHLEKNQGLNNMLIDNSRKEIDSKPAFDRNLSWAEESKKKGMDVVSFTFTAPLTRSIPGYETSGQLVQKNSGACMDNRGKRLLLDTDSMKLSSVGYNVIGGDALSNLLEQKLRELTNTVESSGRNPVKTGSASTSASFLQDLTPALNSGGTTPNSLDSTYCSSTEGSKQCSSIQAQEIFGFNSSKKFHYVDADTDLSDSASSTSNGITARKHANIFPVTDIVKSTNWEIEYVQKILCNLEYMFNDFALGRASEIINPHLFNQLENRKEGLVSDSVEARLERKVIFDCVGECLDIRCRRYVVGGCKSWSKGVMTVRRKDWLAEEVLKEVSGWRGMGDCMVDELVDKDMSSQYGRWLDFEVDAFVLGTEIECQIYNTLLDEVVADIFLR